MQRGRFVSQASVALSISRCQNSICTSSRTSLHLEEDLSLITLFIVQRITFVIYTMARKKRKGRANSAHEEVANGDIIEVCSDPSLLVVQPH